VLGYRGAIHLQKSHFNSNDVLIETSNERYICGEFGLKFPLRMTLVCVCIFSLLFCLLRLCVILGFCWIRTQIMLIVLRLYVHLFLAFWRIVDEQNSSVLLYDCLSVCLSFSLSYSLSVCSILENYSSNVMSYLYVCLSAWCLFVFLAACLWACPFVCSILETRSSDAAVFFYRQFWTCIKVCARFDSCSSDQQQSVELDRLALHHHTLY